MDNRLKPKHKEEESDLLRDAEAEFNPATPQLRRKASQDGLFANSLFVKPTHNRKYSDVDGLPDFTDEVMDGLSDNWSLGKIVEHEGKSSEALVDAVGEYWNTINPYLEALKEKEESWYTCWEFLYSILLNLKNAAMEHEQKRIGEYSIPIKLQEDQSEAESKIYLADEEYEEANEAWLDESTVRGKEIVQTEKFIENINAATTVLDLQKIQKEKDNFDAAVRQYRRGKAEKAGVKRADSDEPGCWKKFSAFFHPKKNDDGQGQALKQSDFEPLKTKMLKEYKEKVSFTQLLMEESSGPVKTREYEKALRKVKAEILHNRIDYYRSQSQNVMRHALRLYVLAFRTYHRIYGKSPLEKHKANRPAKTEPKKIKTIYDANDALIAKAKKPFKRFINEMKGHLDTWYCEQPQRYKFDDYLNNYVSIESAKDRDAILNGENTQRLKDQVFKEWESEMEAFYPKKHMY